MLAVRNLANNKLRTILTILGISLAVLSIILIASIGNGLLTTGNKLMDKNTFHLWITGKASDLQSQYLMNDAAMITDAHFIVNNIKKDKEITQATPLLTEMVYAFREGAEPRAIFALGLEHITGSMITVTKGSALEKDTHYNNGTYNGMMSYEALIDSRTASLLNVNVGDTIHIGKTITEAREQKFKIMGLTDSLSRFSSNPMVILYLSELQEITGNQYYDNVNLLIIRLKNPGNVIEIQKDLQEQYPMYTVSTNQDYLIRSIKQNSLPVASATSIVVLAVIMGTMLAVNSMFLSLNEKKKEIAILNVLGFNRLSIFRSIGTEGMIICLTGGLLSVIIATPLIQGMNELIHTFMGFNGLVVLETEYLYLGLLISLFIGLITSFLAAFQITRMNPEELLRST